LNEDIQEEEDEEDNATPLDSCCDQEQEEAGEIYEDEELNVYVPDEAKERRLARLEVQEEILTDHFRPIESLDYDTEVFKAYVMNRDDVPNGDLEFDDLYMLCQLRIEKLVLSPVDDCQELIALYEDTKGCFGRESLFILLYALGVENNDHLTSFIRRETSQLRVYGREKGVDKKTIDQIIEHHVSNMMDFVQVMRKTYDRQPWVLKGLLKQVVKFWVVCEGST
jgi:hypothetical protein